ncbi:hypothetical protein GCM10009416_37770 [Craurococcus roseus]|uniref:HEPN domain-containing protein n=1 Tax=Craurococcus roseus TaxID=77585 RepID=A0ABN1FR69_9PROT
MVERKEALAAWAVLEDAARSVDLAVNADEDHWRVHWAGSLALLRAVGHVLRKVDRERSESHRKCGDEWWKRWDPKKGTEAKPNLFADFIETERNLVLKQYEFRFDPAERHGILFLRSSDKLLTRDGKLLFTRSLERFVITDGAFKDRDGRELLRESHRWWAAQLSEIDARIGALHSTGDRA